MEYQEALKLVEDAIARKEGRSLNNVEIAVFQGSWEGLTYEEIATKFGYEVNYLKGDAGHKFWKLLSKAIGDRITKTNFRAVLVESRVNHGISDDRYIERPPLEERCEQEILQPSALLRIKGNPKMGKTWLLTRLIKFAESQGYHAVYLSLKLADREDYNDINSFLQWLCLNVSQKMLIKDNSQDNSPSKQWWDNQIGNGKVTAMTYVEKYWLSNDKPLVLALDDLDEVFKSGIAEEFLIWLRVLHEQLSGTGGEQFKLILAYRESYDQLPSNVSPFNIGLEQELRKFTDEQTRRLDA